MSLATRRSSAVPVLLGLPILSNLASLLIFAPLFAPGRVATSVDFRSAGVLLGIAVIFIELVGFVLVTRGLRQEGASLKELAGFQRSRLSFYFATATAALIPTLALGWLYVEVQRRAGIDLSPAQMQPHEVLLWYLLTPAAAALLEEMIWRGYAIARMGGGWRGLILTSVSFAMFHGVFNPVVVAIAFFQGLVWGWAYLRTGSVLPGCVLHGVSRYLGLIAALA
ncbi:MAG: CPBP family intramembrane glutamic endopeptidase [Chloroflexota bacterium]